MTDIEPSSTTIEWRSKLRGLIPEMRTFARSLTGAEHSADDLVQQTLLKGWAARERYQPGTNLKAWLFTILRNTHYSDRRKVGRVVEDPEGIATANLAEPAEQGQKLELFNVRRAIATLPDDQRDALILVGAAGLSHEEAAEVMACAVGTVKSRVSRARGALEDAFDSADGTEKMRPAAEVEGTAATALTDLMAEAADIVDDAEGSDIVIKRDEGDDDR